MIRPYHETFIYENRNYILVERFFSSDIDPLELVWHRDHEDRMIFKLQDEDTTWQFQLDNELPRDLNKSNIFIEKGIYHRIVKGDGDLTLRVLKYKK